MAYRKVSSKKMFITPIPSLSVSVAETMSLLCDTLPRSHYSHRLATER